MNYRACFLINNLNKVRFVYRCVAGALAQTYPCHILVADAQSTDGSMAEIMRAIKESPRGADHKVEAVTSPKGENNFQSFSDNFMWAVERTDAEWIVQCSSDDYSLPERTAICMKAVEENPCSAVATAMYFAKPPGDEIDPNVRSGFPMESGYVSAEDGLQRLAYGSCIAAYSREFINKVGGFGTSTPDVLYGFLASLDKGYYVVADPQHVHVQHESVNNLGFQGKLLAATGDESLLLNELNHLQLAMLYDNCMERAHQLHPEGVPGDAVNACARMILGQCKGLIESRKVLNAKGLRPMVLV